MKRLIVFVMLVVMAGSLYAQRDNRVIEDYPEQLDSMYYMKWDAANEQWIKENVRHYFYTKENLTSLLLLDGLTRDSVWVWNYYYDNSNNQNLDILEKWTGGVKAYSQKKESQFQNNLKQSEVIFVWKNNSWVQSSKYTYTYQGDLVLSNLYQLTNKAGAFYNYQYSRYSYNSQNKITELLTYNSSDGSFVKSTEYIYQFDKLSQAIFKVAQKSTAGVAPEIKNSQLREYKYDQYGLLREVFFYNWENEQWVLAYKYIYFYKIDFARKVTICHNERTINVAKEAVPAHLAHGDYLGKCKVTILNPKDERKSLQNAISVFPNPAKDNFTLKLNTQETGAKHYGIYNLTGKLVKTAQIGSDETFVDITGIPNGIYLIKVFGNQVYEQKIVKQ